MKPALMLHRLSHRSVLPALVTVLVGSASIAKADFFSATNSWSGGELIIPDGEPEGVADTIVVDLPVAGWIEDLKLSLDVVGTGSGGFNGDLYVTLTHDSGFSVLLNRVGRTDESAFGYSDSGFSTVTFALDGLADVHLYREFLFSDPSIPLGGPLTGSWQADGRVTDPSLVLDTDDRPAGLDSFIGGSPNGEWTLFLADLSPGGETRLQSWSISITTSQVPEPSVGSLVLIGGGLLGWLRKRRL